MKDLDLRHIKQDSSSVTQNDFKKETYMKYSVVFVTVPNKKEAKKIADSVLKEKLVACVNIVNKLESIYWWKGKIEKSNELLLIMKTKTSLSKKLIQKIKSIHTYEVPEIIFLPITDGNLDYLNWIGEETR